MGRQPRLHAILGAAVAGGGVPVVDAELEKHVEHGIGLLLAGGGQSGAAEDHPATEVTGSPEYGSFDHDLDPRPTVHVKR